MTCTWQELSPLDGHRRRIDHHGYVRVTCGGDKQGFEYEHRIVMRRKLGRNLRRTEHVHHINGNRADNRPENLELLSHAKHIALHNHNSPKRRRTTTISPAELKPAA